MNSFGQNQTEVDSSGTSQMGTYVRILGCSGAWHVLGPGGVRDQHAAPCGSQPAVPAVGSAQLRAAAAVRVSQDVNTQGPKPAIRASPSTWFLVRSQAYSPRPGGHQTPWGLPTMGPPTEPPSSPDVLKGVKLGFPHLHSRTCAHTHSVARPVVARLIVVKIDKCALGWRRPGPRGTSVDRAAC